MLKTPVGSEISSGKCPRGLEWLSDFFTGPGFPRASSSAFRVLLNLQSKGPWLRYAKSDGNRVGHELHSLPV